MTNSVEYAKKASEANKNGKIVQRDENGNCILLSVTRSNEEIAAEMRRKRDCLLAESDKYVNVPDFPITTEKREAYKTYRQKLRDLPEQTGFPLDIVFPTAP